MLKTIEIQEAKNLVVHGRNGVRRQPLTLFWTASGLEMNLHGSEIWVEFESDFSLYEQWISVILNGAHIARFPLQKGRIWMPVLRGLDAQKTHHIEIIRDVQAMPTDPDCSLRVHALRYDGELLPVAEKKLRLEVIGDSLTSSEGAIGAKTETDWIAPFFCAAHGYPYLLRQKLNADLRVISQSGWGALTSWDNDPHCAMPLYYDQVCGVLKGEKNAALGAFEPNDFEAWNADVVVVNLGANDSSAFEQGPWTDPETGIAYKQRKNEDGTRNAEDVQKLSDAMLNFLVKIRKRNPHAYLIWVHGMFCNTLTEVVTNMVEEYKRTTGDARVEAFRMPELPASGVGARNHPGLPMHEVAAQALAEEILTLE